ncbi:hypothetical protein LOTGIDRAFT_232208 [Lottia gigantea]|uniref:Uncharacterized protein n=1 Tax=Lottia gigantea TaxID=225164 RepID=V4C0Y5_LOTGI|nr:hypothetical protein LOTGIDRAFT_232208 [Lottia gigantea]ESO95119.1 hypothetical protein LOTGIDRAFT_232208 [Lottia gigantea]
MTKSSKSTMILTQITIYWTILTFCISGVVEDKPKDETGIPVIDVKGNMGPPIENSSYIKNLALLNKKNHSSRSLQAEYIDYKDMEEEVEDENYFIDDDDLTTAQRFKRHWKRVLSRCLILLAIVIFIVLFCRCLLATVCTFLVPSLKSSCTCLSFLPCCKEEKDTMYVKVQELGKNLGMEINRESYAHLLEICEDEGMTAVKHVKRV